MLDPLISYTCSQGEYHPCEGPDHFPHTVSKHCTVNYVSQNVFGILTSRVLSQRIATLPICFQWAPRTIGHNLKLSEIAPNWIRPVVRWQLDYSLCSLQGRHNIWRTFIFRKSIQRSRLRHRTLPYGELGLKIYTFKLLPLLIWAKWYISDSFKYYKCKENHSGLT